MEIKEQPLIDPPLVYVYSFTKKQVIATDAPLRRISHLLPDRLLSDPQVLQYLSERERDAEARAAGPE